MFEKKGLFIFDSSRFDEDELFMMATEAGAEDITTEGGNIEILCQPQDFQSVKEYLEKNGIVAEENKITMIAKTTVTLDENDAAKVLKVIDLLEEHDDVQDVISNADISEDIMEKIS